MANNLIAKLFLDTKDFNGNLTKASKELKSFKNGCSTASRGVTSFANGLGINIGTLTKFGSVVGAAALAAEGFKTLMEKNDAIGDQYRYTMQNVNDQMDSFWKSVGSGNFNNFISNWDNVNRLSQEYSRALDDAGTYVPIINAQLQVSQTRYNGLVAIAQDVLRSERERKGALAAATVELQKQYALKKSILELEGRKARAAFQLEFSERGGKGKLGDYSAIKLLTMGKDGKFEYQRRMSALEERAKMYEVFKMQNSKGMTGTTLYGGKEYSRAFRDKFIKDNARSAEVYGNLKALDDVVQNNSQMVADYLTAVQDGVNLETFMNEQQKNLDRTLKRIGSGSGSGGSGGSGGGGRTSGKTSGKTPTDNTPKFESGSVADYKNQISQLKSQLDNLNLSYGERKKRLEQIANLEDTINQIQNPNTRINSYISAADAIIQLTQLNKELEDVNLSEDERKKKLERIKDLEKEITGIQNISKTIVSYRTVGVYEEEITKLKKELENIKISEDERAKKVERIAALEDMISRTQNTINKTVVQSDVSGFSLEGLSGVDLDSDKIKEGLKAINEQLQESADHFAELRLRAEEFADSLAGNANQRAQEFIDIWNNTDFLGKSALSFQTLAEMSGTLADGMSQLAQKSSEWATAAAIAEKASRSFAAAAAVLAAVEAIQKAVKTSKNWIEMVVAIGVASTTALGALFSAMGAFETGGIVGGTDYHGDRRTVRVNSGEMILNARQQSNLFNMINNGGIGGGNKVEFVLKGQQLVGLINNFENKRGRTL